MPILFLIIGLFLPRITIALLWFFTGWFTGVFETRGWPILGFLFMPFTLLWYSVVENWLAGQWNIWAIIVLVIAVISDLSSGNSAKKKRHH